MILQYQYRTPTIPVSHGGPYTEPISYIMQNASDHTYHGASQHFLWPPGNLKATAFADFHEGMQTRCASGTLSRVSSRLAMEFRLMVPKQARDDSMRPVATLNDQEWTLSDPIDIYPSQTIPAYACISYVWGTGRSPNAIYPDVQMSDRTIAVLSAAMRNSSLHAFWIDALCLPVDPISRSSTLESMGYIYSRADRVIAVVGAETFAAIQKLVEMDKSNLAPTKEILDIIEGDRWVRSVWTYQEIVNSRDMYFVGEDLDTVPLHASEFLNRFGHGLQRYRATAGLTTLILRSMYPGLDALEDVIADWMVSGYADRSAMEVISNISRRTYDDPRNYYYAMIGAVTNLPSTQVHAFPTVEYLAEIFMEICEEKGDYSFIFTSNPRDERPGYGWRPRPGLLLPILPVPSKGGILAVERNAEGLRVKNMMVLRPSHSSSLSEEGRLFLKGRLSPWVGEVHADSDDELARICADMLIQAGFTGDRHQIVTDHGLFFPQNAIAGDVPLEVWAASSLAYHLGTPALGVAGAVNNLRYIPGVYVGLKDIAVGDVCIPLASSDT
ncbi:hypothetical protein K474DRAFT_1666913 [Panus rudis PR-1116 ss-1]|nr:hypothetical protein K474DRAFT_1666913 [Panus rudis PR-1116 ss-1]